MPIVKIHNVETGEIIEREMNDEELAQFELSRAIVEAEQAAEEQARLDAESKAATKAAALERLGLTEEEINAFLN